MSNLKFMLIAVLSVMAALSSGCDEYEREQMREAADDVGSAHKIMSKSPANDFDNYCGPKLDWDCFLTS